MFRNEIQEMLKANFEFYAMTAHSDIEPETYIRQNFQSILGKVYHPFEDRKGSSQQYFSLALRKPEKEHDAIIRQRISDENDAVLHKLKEDFYVAKCPLGVDPKLLPKNVMPIVEPRPHIEIPKGLLTIIIWRTIQILTSWLADLMVLNNLIGFSVGEVRNVMMHIMFG